MIETKDPAPDPRDRYELQESEYGFPYHHIPHLDESGDARRHRVLSWGFEYLCYLQHARELIESLQPRSVLDVGCGDGRLLGMIDRPGLRRVGVDLSERAIRFAAAFHPDVSFASGDADELDETFDVVVALEVLEHVPDDRVGSFLRLLERRMAPAGRLVISVPSKVLELQPKHYRHYDAALLEEQLHESGCGLTIERVDSVYRRDWLVRLYSELTSTRWWLVEIDLLRRWIWRRVWRRLRRATPETGHRLVACIRRSSEPA